MAQDLWAIRPVARFQILVLMVTTTACTVIFFMFFILCIRSLSHNTGGHQDIRVNNERRYVLFVVERTVPRLFVYIIRCMDLACFGTGGHGLLKKQVWNNQRFLILLRED